MGGTGKRNIRYIGRMSSHTVLCSIAFGGQCNRRAGARADLRGFPGMNRCQGRGEGMRAEFLGSLSPVAIAQASKLETEKASKLETEKTVLAI